jgi:hypothetical protein
VAFKRERKKERKKKNRPKKKWLFGVKGKKKKKEIEEGQTKVSFGHKQRKKCGSEVSECHHFPRFLLKVLLIIATLEKKWLRLGVLSSWRES